MDTDSIIWVKDNEDDNPMPTGQFLGDMCSELDPGVWIQKFVSGGPKNYLYTTNKGQLKITVKGKHVFFII